MQQGENVVSCKSLTVTPIFTNVRKFYPTPLFLYWLY